jgi:hypothetical protein
MMVDPFTRAVPNRRIAGFPNDFARMPGFRQRPACNLPENRQSPWTPVPTIRRPT